MSKHRKQLINLFFKPIKRKLYHKRRKQRKKEYLCVSKYMNKQ